MVNSPIKCSRWRPKKDGKEQGEVHSSVQQAWMWTSEPKVSAHNSRWGSHLLWTDRQAGQLEDMHAFRQSDVRKVKKGTRSGRKTIMCMLSDTDLQFWNSAFLYLKNQILTHKLDHFKYCINFNKPHSMVRTPSLFVPLVKFCINLVRPFAGFFFFFFFCWSTPDSPDSSSRNSHTKTHTYAGIVLAKRMCVPWKLICGCFSTAISPFGAALPTDTK